LRRLLLTALLAFALPAAAMADTLAAIKDRGTVRLGVRTDATAFSFTDTLGETSGYTVQLCRGIAADLKSQLGLPELTIEYVEVTTEDRFQAIQDGRIDMLCGATTVTLGRREMIDFSSPTFLTGMGVLYREGGPSSFAELEGKTIGVRSGTTTEDVLERELTKLGLEATFVSVDSHQQGVQDLQDGTIDGYFADRAILIFLYLASENNENLVVSERLFTHEIYAIGLPLGDTAFRLAVDSALSRIYQSETIDRIYAASFGDLPPGEGLRFVYLMGAFSE